MPALVGRSGPLAGSRFELDGAVVLGRENAAITLADEETSRRHAEIRVADGAVLIEDLGSTNGTFVDERRIVGAVELRGGETIRLGQSTFAVEFEAAAQPEVDPGATRVSARPEPIDDPDATALREQPAKPAAVAEPQVTAPRPRPPAPARTPPKQPLVASAGPSANDQPFGSFAPPVPVRRRGVASRKLAPTLVSAATILLTAMALVAYFAGR